VVMAPLVALTVLFGVWPAPLLDVTAAAVKKLVAGYNQALAEAGKATLALVLQ